MHTVNLKKSMNLVLNGTCYINQHKRSYKYKIYTYIYYKVMYLIFNEVYYSKLNKMTN